MGLPTFRTPTALKNSLTAKERWRDLDLPSTVLILLFSGIFLYLLQFGPLDEGPLSTKTISLILLLFALLVSLSLFIYRQHQLGDKASIPRSVIARPGVSLCCLYVLLMQMSSPIIYYLPIYYQAAKAESARASGIQLVALLAATSAAQFISATIFVLVKGHSSVGAMICGAMLLASGAGLLLLLDTNTPQATLTAVQILAGLGMGFGTQMPLIEAQREFQVAARDGNGEKGTRASERQEHMAREAKLIPISNGLILFSTFMGLSVGVSVGQSIFTTALQQDLALVPGLADPAGVLNAGAASIEEAVAPSLQEAVRTAYDYAVRKVFWLPTASAGVALITACSLVFYKSRRKL